MNFIQKFHSHSSITLQSVSLYIQTLIVWLFFFCFCFNPPQYNHHNGIINDFIEKKIIIFFFHIFTELNSTIIEWWWWWWGFRWEEPYELKIFLTIQSLFSRNSFYVWIQNSIHFSLLFLYCFDTCFVHFEKKMNSFFFVPFSSIQREIKLNSLILFIIIIIDYVRIENLKKKKEMFWEFFSSYQSQTK